MMRTASTYGKRSERRFQCYCVGAGKTGTRSIAGIFAREFAAAHEPASEELISWILKYHRGTVTAQSVTQFLSERDEALGLEVESDGTLAPFLNFLVDSFPNARFILTVRDCYTWLDSVLNHNVSRSPGGMWLEFDDFKYGRVAGGHPPEEHELAARGLRTIDDYLTHWATHIDRIVDTVPRDRLLIVRTDRISTSLNDIARFLEIRVEQLDDAHSHMNENSGKKQIVTGLDPQYIEGKVQVHCAKWMNEIFPHWV